MNKHKLTTDYYEIKGDETIKTTINNGIPTIKSSESEPISLSSLILKSDIYGISC